MRGLLASMVVLLFGARIALASPVSAGAAGHGRPATIEPRHDGLLVAAIQLQIPGSRVVTPSVFESAVTGAMERAVSGGEVDLVVFPEYTSVFPSLFPFADDVVQSVDVHDLMSRIARRRPAVDSPLAAFQLHSAETESYLDAFWGNLARQHGLRIVAGSYFAVHCAGNGACELRNRMLYYNRRGERAYVQDKVYPTPFELEFLHLGAGNLRHVETILIEDTEVGVSICNDTFYESWERLFDGTDLWIDIKGNNADFNEHARRVFRRALPERLAGVDGNYGLTVCLGGEFLDLFWEGPSSFIRGRTHGIEVIERAPSADGPAILLHEIP